MPELLIGPTNPTLTDYVRMSEFDLVTASAGNLWLSVRGWSPWFEVARLRPVLIVGTGTSESWVESGTGGVVVVLDGSVAAEEALAPAVALCRLLDAPLILLRVRLANGSGDSENL
jgi:hypothetical protein